MRYISFAHIVLLITILSGCSDTNNTNVSSSQEVFYAVGGVVYVGDSPGDGVTVTISDSESVQWSTTSNSDGLWRLDNDFPPGTYKVEYSTPDLPPLENIFNIYSSSYDYGSGYFYIENGYVYLGQVNLIEQPLEASISPFAVTLQNQQELRDGAGGQVVQYSLSADSDIEITFNYPLWSANEICLIDYDGVPLFKDTNADGQGDYPLCANYDANTSTFTFARSDLDQAYLGIDSFGSFMGTSTLVGMIADGIPTTQYLLWVGVTITEYAPNEYGLSDYYYAGMQAFSPLYGTEFSLQGKLYFNVVP